MTKTEALELLVSTKSAPALSRSFIAWLYKNGYKIISDEEEKEIIKSIEFAADLNQAFGNND